MSLLTLESWLSQTYAPDSAPSVITVRRWIKEGRILPRPQKQGRAYYFRPEARYVDVRQPVRLVERIA